ncbi:hypothetical protein [Bradyrhizobium sp. CCBAU 53380]|uniref:hypothetical protein n=1 Tax=Bradyrhizobium sp. CCBAU 53380 TaxID=1325117 RepID=UPI00230403F1|nr:hypothetical protein [Bradyrhizobium sp. CCBAU 53380]MDA9424343.1 hypothetical protein [Bradyrhizobium sp. CCBAU 53380]
MVGTFFKAAAFLQGSAKRRTQDARLQYLIGTQRLIAEVISSDCALTADRMIQVNIETRNDLTGAQLYKGKWVI